jgi:two-component system CheB/CheR fusion protein
MAATEIPTLFLDRSLRIHRFTPSVGELFNVDPSDIGRLIGDFTHGLDYGDLQADARTVLRDLTTLEREIASLDGHGFLVRLRPYRTGQDRIDGVVITFVDVTEQRRAADALRQSRQQLGEELEAIKRLHQMTSRVVRAPTMPEAMREILAAATDIMRTDLGVLRLLDPETNRLHVVAQVGFQPGRLDGPESGDASDGSASARALQTSRRVVIEDVMADARYAGHREIAGAAGYRAVQATPFVSQSGKTLGVLATHFRQTRVLTTRDEQLLDLLAGHAGDLLDRLRTEEMLSARTHDLTESDRRKTEFLGMLGHELRNPLAALYSGLEALTMSASAPDKALGDASVRRILVILERQTRLMSRLVNDLLDIARINQGKIRIERRPVDLAESLETCVAALRQQVDEKRIALVTSLPDTRVYVDADPERLVQMMDNLVGNAVKFTRDGGRIDLTVTVDDGAALINVRDDGIGIPHQVIATLFEPFTQGEVADRSGLGLGLALVKSLADLHGGDVSARSDGPGRGAEFVLRLPCARNAAPPSMARTEEGPPRRILVVDDNVDAADSFAILLRTRGHEVEVAYDATTARSIASRLRPDVAFLDLRMPDVDGYALAGLLRDDFPTGAPTLVAMSGYPEEDRIRESAFDRHILKPANLDVVVELLRTWGDGRPPRPPLSPSA